MKNLKKLFAAAAATAAITVGSTLSAGAAHADVGWIGGFSSSWTCEQNASSWGWDATCKRFDDGRWYWWCPE